MPLSSTRKSRSLLRHTALTATTALALALPTFAAANANQKIEVAFVLDTTGSMADLIDGAKRKIWSIANTIVDVNPDADIHMALVGYRDYGDDYVLQTHDLSPDIQALYGNLMRFRAGGGVATRQKLCERLQ